MRPSPGSTTHVAGAPVIVEASNGPYAWYSRVSIYTGLPDVLGWGSHESQQRYGDEVYSAPIGCAGFYATDGPERRDELPDEYHRELCLSWGYGAYLLHDQQRRPVLTMLPPARWPSSQHSRMRVCCAQSIRQVTSTIYQVVG